jgi:hypothetical protein
MLIAQQKRQENIAEYLLYMFQIEDLIRASDFNIEEIERTIISRFDQPYTVKREMREWYLSLIGMIKDNGLEKTGHIPLLLSLIDELENLHRRLLDNLDEIEYSNLYKKAGPAIEELRIRSHEEDIGDVGLGLHGLYGLLLLRLQQRTVNPETEKAFGFISEWLAELTVRFHQLEQGRSEY